MQLYSMAFVEVEELTAAKISSLRYVSFFVTVNVKHTCNDCQVAVATIWARLPIGALFVLRSFHSYSAKGSLVAFESYPCGHAMMRGGHVKGGMQGWGSVVAGRGWSFSFLLHMATPPPFPLFDYLHYLTPLSNEYGDVHPEIPQGKECSKSDDSLARAKGGDWRRGRHEKRMNVIKSPEKLHFFGSWEG